MAAESVATGAIPYRLLVGVTGHRTLPDPDRMQDRVREALLRIREIAPSSPDTPLYLTIVSPLAEGADRLVAWEALRAPDTSLEAPLPMAVELYMRDFKTAESKTEFRELLDRASFVIPLQHSQTAEEAYERAGRYVVRRSDVLIALWDGKPARGQGGTAEVVEMARKRRMPIAWIQTEAPFELRIEGGDGIPSAAFKRLDAYNRLGASEKDFTEQITRETRDLHAHCRQAGLDEQAFEPFLTWLLPYFVRADLLANGNQKRFYRLGAAIFYLAALSVVVGAAETLFLEKYFLLGLVEVGIMLAVLAILLLGRRFGLHERWLAYRFLAEHFRTRLFLATAGVNERGETVDLEHLPHEWLGRACDAVWDSRPRTLPGHPHAIRALLSDAWIGGQIGYQARTSERSERRHEQITWLSIAFFAATLLAALLHVMVAQWHGSADTTWLNSFTFLAIVLPALAGAFRAVEAQREYHRTSERCKQMVRLLTALKERMDEVHDLRHVQQVAREVETVMLSENRDWFVVMQFHDFELHV